MRLYSRRSAGRKSVLEQTCKPVYLVHEMVCVCVWEGRGGLGGKRAKQKQQQPQSVAAIALETTQGHFVLLCQLSYFIQRDEGWGRRGRRWREEGGCAGWKRRAELKSTNEVNGTLVCSQRLGVNREVGFNE